ncbi:hypothetical protein [Campylobacter jejuni]|nr:hypothetical protein [Campylobacter jejuni]
MLKVKFFSLCTIVLWMKDESFVNIFLAKLYTSYSIVLEYFAIIEVKS